MLHLQLQYISGLLVASESGWYFGELKEKNLCTLFNNEKQKKQNVGIGIFTQIKVLTKTVFGILL